MKDRIASAVTRYETLKAKRGGEAAHGRLCKLLALGGYAAVIRGGRCYVGTACMDINDFASYEFPTTRLLNLDATEGGVR